MNTQKYKIGNCGLLNEADRTMYEGKDTASRSLIDHERSVYNYNLCSHEQYTQSEIRAIHERIRGKKMRKDAVAFGSTILTLPKDFEGDSRQFFEESYKVLRHIYRLREEDIVSAYVHMDETTPHMHFYFLPVHREGEKISMSWEKKITRHTYQTQHRAVEQHLERVLGVKCKILNGKTLGIGDINKLSPEAKLRGMEEAKELEEIRKAIEQERSVLGEIVSECNEMTKEKNSLVSELDELTQEKDRRQSIIQELNKEIEKLQSIDLDMPKMHVRSLEANVRYLINNMEQMTLEEIERRKEAAHREAEAIYEELEYGLD